jgi:hypothetical protein
MAVTASSLFRFIEHQEALSLDRYEVMSAEFGVLRRSIRRMTFMLCEADDHEARELVDRLRTFLSEWLTTPVPFDNSMLQFLPDCLGSEQHVRARWGNDFLNLYRDAVAAAVDLQLSESPLRAKLQSSLKNLLDAQQPFKIFCNRNARSHFESLLPQHLAREQQSSMFLHSVRDYRESEPFEVLIKVGPLRARGWGSAPDALVNAPRFSTLLQIVWAGCGDDPDFGYDPTAVATNLEEATGSDKPPLRAGSMVWKTRVTVVGEHAQFESTSALDIDDLREFTRIEQPQDRRKSVLIQIDQEHGILYPPYSQVLSFDPNALNHNAAALRIPGQALVEGMYVIMPLLRDLEHEGAHAEHGHYSRDWKGKLGVALNADSNALLHRLEQTGLRLTHLESAVRNWARPPTTVIHAPQQRGHFEILLRVLGFSDVGKTNRRARSLAFWERAWNEIRQSRGEAIQAGVQEHGVIQQQALAVLSTLAAEIRMCSNTHQSFRLGIPANAGLTGELSFFKISGLEEGFIAPEGDLKVIRELKQIYQWRV